MRAMIIGGLTTVLCESVSDVKVYPVAFTGCVGARASSSFKLDVLSVSVVWLCKKA